MWQFVPVTADGERERDAVLAAAAGRVQLRTYYGALHRTPAFRACERAGSLDVTEALADRMLSLPMAVDLSSAELELVAQVVAEGTARAGAVLPGARRA